MAIAEWASPGPGSRERSLVVKGERGQILAAFQTATNHSMYNPGTTFLRVLELSAEFSNDRTAVLAAVKLHGAALGFASEELQNDREIVSEAVSNTGIALEWASDELQADPEIVLTAVSSYGCILDFASEELQADKTIVLEAVSDDGNALQWASEDLRADKEVVLAAVTESGFSLEHASEDLRADEDFILHCARVSREARYCYQEAHESLKQRKSLKEIESAASSALAVRGELGSPVLSVTLTLVASSTDDVNMCYRADTLLVSGREFLCEVFCEIGSEPVLNDLAQKLRDELQKDPGPASAGTPKAKLSHVFITFQTSEDEWEPVTAWDHDRPLRDFVFNS